ncbi:conserved hypothetical protein [Ricinus communis]|uniref:RNase H type-1 domain-containing protein n=1 Tax=Ricinus communis TaxID=3988 RepID=B9S2G4_RICCO|nr:conserved hypothetical protein [Ricinus communis]
MLCGLFLLNGNEERATIAFVVRNDRGIIVHAAMKRVKCTSALMAEAMSLREAVDYAHSAGIDKVSSENDSSVVAVRCESHDENITWEVHPIMEEIHLFKESRQF